MILEGHLQWPTPELEAAATQLLGWALESMRLSGVKESVLARMLGIKPPRAIEALYTNGDPTLLTLKCVLELGKLARRAVPPEIITCVVALERWRVTNSVQRLPSVSPSQDTMHAAAADATPNKQSVNWQVRLAKLSDRDFVIPGDTAAGELAALIDLALRIRGTQHPERDRALIRARYGLGTRRQTLQEVAVSVGLTRERVRQAQTRVEEVWREGANRWQAAMFGTLRAALPMHSGRPVAKIEHALRDVLGGLTLRAALAAAQSIWGVGEEWQLSRRSRKGEPVLDTLGGHAVRRAEEALTLARKLQRFAGAVSVADWYATTREDNPDGLDLRQLHAILDAMPEVRWLDEQRRYFMFAGEPETRIARQVKMILAIAEKSIQFELVYAGLVRGARRKYVSQAARSTDAVPPALVLRTALAVEPTIVRGRGDLLDLRPRAAWRDLVSGDVRAVIEILDASNGGLTIWDLRRELRQRSTGVGRVSLNAILTFAPFIDRLSECFYALRGREIPAAQLAHAADVVRQRTGKRPSLRSSGCFEIEVRNANYVASSGSVYARCSEVPEGVAGAYRVSAMDTTCALVDDANGIRLRSLGAPFKAAIVRAGRGSRLIFDAHARTVALMASAHPRSMATEAVVNRPSISAIE